MANELARALQAAFNGQHDANPFPLIADPTERRCASPQAKQVTHTRDIDSIPCMAGRKTPWSDPLRNLGLSSFREVLPGQRQRQVNKERQEQEWEIHDEVCDAGPFKSELHRVPINPGCCPRVADRNVVF